MQYQSIEKSKRERTPSNNDIYNYSVNNEISMMDKGLATLGYITLFGWLIAVLLHGWHKSNFASFHLRQSLGLIITGALLSLIPLIGWLLNIAVCFAWLFSLFHVVQGHKVKVPLLGDFYQTHLDFIM
jgi:uncharacterized membrane protein